MQKGNDEKPSEELLNKIARTPIIFDVPAPANKEIIIGDGAAGYYRELVEEALKSAALDALDVVEKKLTPWVCHCDSECQCIQPALARARAEIRRRYE